MGIHRNPSIQTKTTCLCLSCGKVEWHRFLEFPGLKRSEGKVWTELEEAEQPAFRQTNFRYFDIQENRIFRRQISHALAAHNLHAAAIILRTHHSREEATASFPTTSPTGHSLGP